MRFLSHLDMMRLWERALRRARLPLRYSQGYHPHPRLSLALPLAVGMTTAADWLECELASPLPPEEVRRRLVAQLPVGIGLCRVIEAPWQAVPLAARLRTSVYTVYLCQPPPLNEVQERVRRFLQADSWAVEEEHKGRLRRLDVRTMVQEVKVGPWEEGQHPVHLILRHEAGRAVRVQTVLQALGLGPAALIHRRELSFGTVSSAGQDGAVC